MNDIVHEWSFEFEQTNKPLWPDLTMTSQQPKPRDTDFRTPTFRQRLLASRWLDWLIGTSGAIAGGVLTYRALGPVFADTFVALWSLPVVLLGAVLGWILTILGSGFLLGPMTYDQGLKNGGPYEVGDRVQIIAGKHSGCIARVVGFGQFRSLRVDVGDGDAEQLLELADHQVLRQDIDGA